MEIVTALISAIIGGVIATLMKSYVDKRNSIDIGRKEIVKESYKNLLIFMACAIDYDKRRYYTLKEQVPNITSEDYLNQLREYYYHSVLYSTEAVIISLKRFINSPSKETYIATAKEMRKELWGTSTDLDYEDIFLDN